MSSKWTPSYIKRNINYRPKDVLTAQEYNAILNLLITQGDYNSSWIEYLQNDAIPEAIAEIGMEAIEAALTEAVREEIDSLAHEVTSKTSVQLNNPAVTILNTGLQAAPWASFATLLESKGLKATYVAATNLVGYTAYPTLAQLQSMKLAGNDVLAYSTDGATLTTETVDSAASTARNYMELNDLNTEVFVYPNGNSVDAVANAVHNYFMYAVNIASHSVITPDGITAYSPVSVLGNIPVIKCDSTVDFDTLKEYIDNVVTSNKYMILQVDTDDSTYDAELLEDVLDYMLEASSIRYPASISDQMHTIHNTVGNLLNLVSGIAITEVSGEKYINW